MCFLSLSLFAFHLFFNEETFDSSRAVRYRNFREIVAINRVWPIVGINFKSFDAANGHVASAIVRRIYDFRKESPV